MTQQTLEHLAIKAIQLKLNLGTRCGAGYLRNRGASLEQTLSILVPRARLRD